MKSRKRSVSVTEVLDFMFGKSASPEGSSQHGILMHKNREKELEQYKRSQMDHGKAPR
jgi:hypothetical protein